MAKRKLNYLTFDDVIVPISLVLIENWIDCGPSLDNTSTVANSAIYGEGVDPEKLNEPPTLDKDFLTSLRDLKVDTCEQDVILIIPFYVIILGYFISYKLIQLPIIIPGTSRTGQRTS